MTEATSREWFGASSAESDSTADDLSSVAPIE